MTFRTLDRQIPDFKIVNTNSNKNETCSSDRSCVIRWIIESDGGAPIIRAEILHAKVKIKYTETKCPEQVLLFRFELI